MTTATANPMAHSYSRLLQYSQCPLSYKLATIDKVGTDDSGPMEIGAAAHEFFERFVGGNKFCDNTEPAAFDAYVLSLAATCFQKDSRDQSNFKEVLEICQIFAKAYRRDPAYPSSINEMQVAFDRNWQRCDWFSRDTYFRAKIDRIDQPAVASEGKLTRIKIIDYKTGYAGTLDSFQLDVYAFVASLIFPGLREVEVEFYYAKSGYRQSKLLEVDDMGIVQVQLEALMDRIEAEKKFKAKPGARCLNCGVAAFCDKKPSELVAIAKPEDAEMLATDIALLEAQAKAKKKALNAYCKENGPVSAAGLTFSFWPRESMKVDFGPVISACVKYAIDPALVFNPDTTALRKLIKKNPDFADAIMPYINIEIGYSFASRKSDEE